MCPPASVSALSHINESWTDEELVLFLVQTKYGDPLPQNVLTGVDPFSIEPRNSPENIWYMNNTGDQQPPDRENEECGIKEAKNGYWKSMNSFRVPTGTTLVGRKIILEFYEGKEPAGKKTGWVMHEYRAERNAERVNKPQDYSSLFRVFLQTDQRQDNEEQQLTVNAIADSDYLESYLLYLVELEEQNAVEKSQIVAGNEQRVTCSKGSDEQKTHNAADSIPAPCAFSNEDYLELNDLLSVESSSSSSENSSKRSIISDEYFDADALLRDIANDCNTDGKEDHVDCKFSISAPVKSDQVVINPSEQGLIQTQGSNVMLTGSLLGNSVPSVGVDLCPTLPSSTAELQHSGPATSGSSLGSQVKRNHSDSSQGSSKSPQRQRMRSIGRFAKIGKKYCCFGSF